MSSPVNYFYNPAIPAAEDDACRAYSPYHALQQPAEVPNEYYLPSSSGGSTGFNSQGEFSENSSSHRAGQPEACDTTPYYDGFSSVSVHSLLNDDTSLPGPTPIPSGSYRGRSLERAEGLVLPSQPKSAGLVPSDSATTVGPVSVQSPDPAPASSRLVTIRQRTPGRRRVAENSQAATEPAGTGAKKTRVFVSEENKVALMKLCVENKHMNTHGKKKAFWALMSALLEQETGLMLRDPQNTHKVVVAARRAQLQREAKESGTVQEETELTQVVDMWLQREADMEEEARMEKDPSAAEKEAEEAEIVRQNLLLPRAQKRRVDEAEVQGNSPPGSARKSSRSPARSRGEQHEVFLQAMDRLGGSMQDAARVLADSRAQPTVDVEQRFIQLENNLQAQAERHDAAQERNSEMLIQIMGILQARNN
ncbi:hypothetical protein EDC01DRAFT_627462 [Geopyxis carbonaria]|nr:hypothetical protein EDC01DRAFT_627462 [Geopyxis carbonaria]